MTKLNKYHIKLRAIRKAAGLTQAELSTITGIPLGTIGYYETGGGVRVDIYNTMIDACKQRIVENQKLVGGVA